MAEVDAEKQMKIVPMLPELVLFAPRGWWLRQLVAVHLDQCWISDSCSSCNLTIERAVDA